MRGEPGPSEERKSRSVMTQLPKNALDDIGNSWIVDKL